MVDRAFFVARHHGSAPAVPAADAGGIVQRAALSTSGDQPFDKTIGRKWRITKAVVGVHYDRQLAVLADPLGRLYQVVCGDQADVRDTAHALGHLATGKEYRLEPGNLGCMNRAAVPHTGGENLFFLAQFHQGRYAGFRQRVHSQYTPLFSVCVSVRADRCLSSVQSCNRLHLYNSIVLAKRQQIFHFLIFFH